MYIYGHSQMHHWLSHHAIVRLVILAWVGAFIWWCASGASWYLARHGNDEPSTWVGALSVPWLALAIVAGALALTSPTRWTIGMLTAVTVIQVVLVLVTW